MSEEDTPEEEVVEETEEEEGEDTNGDALYTYDQDEMEEDIARGDEFDTGPADLQVVETLEDVLDKGNDAKEAEAEAEAEEEPEEEVEEEPEGVIERTPEEYAEEEGAGAVEEDLVPRTFSVKVDGDDFEVSEEQLISGYQKAQASSLRFQKAADMEKKAKGVLSKFLNPEDAIDNLQELYAQHYNGDFTQAREAVDKMVGKRVEKLMEYESMTEEEKKIKQLEEDNARMAESIERRKHEAERASYVAQVNNGNKAAVPLLDNAINKFDLEMGSAEDTEASETLAEMVRSGREITQEVADQVVNEVVSRKQHQLQAAVSSLSAEELMEANPELAGELQGKKIEQIKKSRATKQAGPPKKKAPTKKRRTKKSSDLVAGSSNDFFGNTDW